MIQQEKLIYLFHANKDSMKNEKIVVFSQDFDLN